MVQEPSGLIDAVVLADGVNTIPLFEGCKPSYKALLPIGGKPSILYTLDALLGVDRVGHICIVGPVKELQPLVGSDTALNGRCEIVEGGDTLLASVRAGLARYPGTSRVLVATAVRCQRPELQFRHDTLCFASSVQVVWEPLHAEDQRPEYSAHQRRRSSEARGG